MRVVSGQVLRSLETKEEVMEEVPAEEQAAMAIKLADDVRKLIREEVKELFRDYAAMQGIMWDANSNFSYALMDRLQSVPSFTSAVLGAVRSQMNKI